MAKAVKYDASNNNCCYFSAGMQTNGVTINQYMWCIDDFVLWSNEPVHVWYMMIDNGRYLTINFIIYFAYKDR